MTQTYTVKQVAQLLGYSTNTIYSFLKEGRLKSIRVGKGRFRIPGEEINRLLSTNANPQLPKFVPTQKVNTILPSLPNPFYLRQGSGKITNYSPPESSIDTKIPSLFNWFIGIASVVVGISLSFFVRSFEIPPFVSYLPWLYLLRLSLITAGVGFLASDILENTHFPWRKIFQIILLINYLSLTMLLVVLGDIIGASVFVLPAVFLFLTLFIKSEKPLIYPLFILFLAFIATGALLFSNSFIPAPWSNIFPLNPRLFSALVFLSLFINLFLLFWSYNKHHRPIFWFIIGLNACFLAFTALLYAQNIYWTKALFCLLAATISPFIAIWPHLKFNSQHNKLTVIGGFSAILMVFVALAFVVQLLQANLLEYAQNQLASQLTYGKSFVTQNLNSLDSILETNAANSLLISALNQSSVSSSRLELLTSLSKTIFDGNKYLHRVLILSAKGDVITSYPYAPSLYGKNLATEDYFKQVVTSQKTTHSENFDNKNNGSTLTISVPVFDQKKLIGVIVGSVDLISLGKNLQQITNGSNSEAFALVDGQNKFLIHSNPDMIGTEANEDFNIIDDNQSIEPGFTTKKGILEASEKIDNWVILAQSSLRDALRFSWDILLIIYTAVLANTVLVILGLFAIQRKK